MKRNNIGLRGEIIGSIIVFFSFFFISRKIFISNLSFFYFSLFIPLVILASIFNISIGLIATLLTTIIGFFFFVINPPNLELFFILIEIFIVIILYMFIYQFYLQREQKSQSHADYLRNIEGKYSILVKKYKENNQLTSSLHKRINKYNLLNTVVQDLSSSLDLDTIIDLIIKHTKKIIGDYKITLWLFENEKLVFKGEKKINTGPCKYDDFDKKVINTSLPLIIENFTKDTAYYYKKNKDLNIFSLISAPLMKGEKTMGLIKVESFVPFFFSQEDLRLLVILADLSAIAIENAKLYKETEKLATIDSLTGVYLHRYFYERLGYDILRAEKHKTFCSLLMIDIDYFKKHNDTYGHLTGDKLLVNLANFLKFNIRKVDILARYGGEEFVVIMPETDKEKARIIATRIKDQIEKQQFIINNQLINCTVSIGVATFPEDATNKDDLIAKSDKAMYKAKELGRNRVI